MPITILGVLLIGWIVVKILGAIASVVAPRSVVLKNLFRILSGLTSLVVALLAIFLGVLQTQKDIREQFTAALISKMTQSPGMDPIRCAHVAHVKGRVLELGFGPGTNFRCWGNSEITEWVGVDPNRHFGQAFADNVAKNNVTFPTSTVWLQGEHADGDVDVEAESFDYVVGTHVLCSVEDVDQVLRQVARALKPGGEFVFMEHVAAEKGTTLDYVQRFIEPFFFLFANGCMFRPVWENLQRTGPTAPFGAGWEVSVEHIDAPVPLPPLVPHILGKAVKGKVAGVV
jgi:SAM-dependent methyltransferase